jgi:hypothetical protein
MTLRHMIVSALAAAALAFGGCYNLPEHAYAPPVAPTVERAELTPAPPADLPVREPSDLPA